MKKEAIRVVIADDHAGVRAGLQRILKAEDDIEVVGMASDGAAAIQMVAAKQPDILLLDVQLPVRRGDEVARSIGKTRWKGRILAISSFADLQLIRSMREAGATGYIMKDQAPSLLVDALRKVFSGDGEWVGVRSLPEDKPLPNRSSLSRREVQVLEMLAGGPNGEAATEMDDMSTTVFSAYVDFLMKKFGVESRAALVDLVHQVDVISKHSPTINQQDQGVKDHGKQNT